MSLRYAPNRLSAGLRPRPHWGSLQRSSHKPPSWYRGYGPRGKGRREGGKKEGVYGRGREGRESRNALIQSWQAYRNTVDCLHRSVILSILISFTDRIWTNLLPLLTISVLRPIYITGGDVSFAIRRISLVLIPLLRYCKAKGASRLDFGLRLGVLLTLAYCTLTLTHQHCSLAAGRHRHCSTSTSFTRWRLAAEDRTVQDRTTKYYSFSSMMTALLHTSYGRR